MKFEIKKAKDGTFTSRTRAANGQIVGSNQQANTKQGAYKNIMANAKIWAAAFEFEDVVITKTPNKAELWVAYTSYEVRLTVCIDVKEINC